MQKIISQSKNILILKASKTKQVSKPEPRQNVVVILGLMQYATMS